MLPSAAKSQKFSRIPIRSIGSSQSPWPLVTILPLPNIMQGKARPELETTDSCFDEIDQLLWREWLSHQQLFLNDAYGARIAFGQRSGYE